MGSLEKGEKQNPGQRYMGNPDSRDTHEIPPMHTNVHTEGAACEAREKINKAGKTTQKPGGGK
jgi:hypothetical protein